MGHRLRESFLTRPPGRNRASLGLVLILAGCVASLTRADCATLPDPVDDATIHPYNNVGYLYGPGRLASGFVASHRAVVVTAAHFFYNEIGSVDVPDGTASWATPRGKVRPTSETYKSLRTHVVYTGSSGYAAMVQQSGPNSLQSFNQDLAIAYGYEDIVDHAPLEVEADSIQRLRSNRNKLIVGNASAFYLGRLRPTDSPDADLLHAAGPNDTRLDTILSDFAPYYLALKNATTNNTKRGPGRQREPAAHSREQHHLDGGRRLRRGTR
jgi:hypothetical protein